MWLFVVINCCSIYSTPDAPAPPGGQTKDDDFSDKSDSDDSVDSDDFD